MTDPRYVDPFKVEATAECSFCKKKVTLSVEACMKLKVGDALYTDPARESFGRCPQCKRKKLVVISVPTITETKSVTGFWKLPTDDGDSSDTKTDPSDTQ